MLLTKPQILNRLADAAKASAGDISNIGGDCYALVVEDEIRAVVALKEIVKQDKSLWIGLPNPVLELVTGSRSLRGMATPDPFRGFIAVSHVKHKTLIMIPIVPVAQDLNRRAAADRADLRDEFDVKMVGYKKYVIQGEEFSGDIPIRHIDTFQPIEVLLALPRSEVEDWRS